MNPGILKLNKIAAKKERLIIGLMSGTSLDGLDIALCKVDGSGAQTHIKALAFETVAYPQQLKKELQGLCFTKQVDLEQLCLMNAFLGDLHAQWINDFLSKHQLTADAIDLIASHGQTIYHAPKRLRGKDVYPNATMQIADGDHIAVKTGIITLSDFRQKNIAQGNEGAPLALYGDYLLFKDELEDRILLNIGGIANFTVLPARVPFHEVISTDVGPGNTLMDQFIQANFQGKFYDEDAEIALQGKVNQQVLEALLDHVFFKLDFPKTTGPELFNLHYINNAIARAKAKSLSREDVLATLNRFTAGGIAMAIRQYFKTSERPFVYLSGGGVHNRLLLKNLKELMPNAVFKNTSALGVNADAKEAILFALLANETIAGDQRVFGAETLNMGKISFPV